MDVFGICPGRNVLVYREKKKVWEGPYKLFKYDNYKTTYVDTGKEIEPFSIAAVKLHRIERESSPPGEIASNPSVGDRMEVYWPNEKNFF